MKYPKIQTVFKRDPNTNHKTLLLGEFSLPEFEILRTLRWEWTEKIDGTNVRVFLSPDKPPEFRGRTDNAQMQPGLLAALGEQFPTDLRTPHDLIIYGEGCGAKIQKGGGRYADAPRFVAFDALVGEFWLERASLCSLAAEYGVLVVPDLGGGSLDAMLDAVCGMQSVYGDFLAEGIVARAPLGLLARNGERLITKIKNKDFKEETDA